MLKRTLDKTIFSAIWQLFFLLWCTLKVSLWDTSNDRSFDKSAHIRINFLISRPKHMLWVLKRTISMRRFFWALKTNLSTQNKCLNWQIRKILNFTPQIFAYPSCAMSTKNKCFLQEKSEYLLSRALCAACWCSPLLDWCIFPRS